MYISPRILKGIQMQPGTPFISLSTPKKGGKDWIGNLSDNIWGKEKSRTKEAETGQSGESVWGCGHRQALRG